MVDEATIQKLQSILDEKMRVIENIDRRRKKDDDEIRELKDIIEE